MATLRRLIVKIGANVDDLMNNLKKGQQAVTNFAAKFGKLGGIIKAGLKAGVLALGAGLALIAGGLLAIFKHAFDLSVETAEAMRMLQQQTGATDEEMVALKQTTLDLFKGGFGKSITDVAQALGQVKNTTQLSGQALEDVTRQAIIMRDVFGKDVLKSTQAANTAVETFGITYTEAFDMIAAVIQRTGDPADDLLDTVNEYSTVFAQAGFSAEEMFGILESGLNAGARNFDVIADAVKEFQIRIIDGSQLTEDALNDLFQATGSGQAYFELKDKIDQTTQALEENQKALESAEGAYQAQEEVVSALERALSEAKRKLDELAHPNLAGFEEFGDKIFDLEQKSKAAQLALLDLEPDTEAYEAAQAELDKINKEIDKLSLQRDLVYDQQFRDLEKAAADSTKEVVTFDQAMASVQQQQGIIGRLEQEYAGAKNELVQVRSVFLETKSANEELTSSLSTMQDELSGMTSPAEEFLAAMNDGTMNGRDAMSQVIQMLKGVDDQLLQNQIGVALFGTKWEDLGPKVILALDPTTAKLEDFTGTVEQAGAALTGGELNQFNQLLRDLQTALIPLGDILRQQLAEALPYAIDFVNQAIPIVRDFTAEFGDKLGPAIMIVVDAINRISQALGITNEDVSGMDLLLGLLKDTLDLIVTSIEAVAIMMHFLADGVEIVSGWLDKLSIDKLSALASIFPGGSISNISNIGPGISDFFSNLDLPSFDVGGTVPGPVGAPTLATVHGGEKIYPPGQGPGNTVIVQIDGVSATVAADGDPVDEAIKMTVGLLRQHLIPVGA